MEDLLFLVLSAVCVYGLFMHDFTGNASRDLDYIVAHPDAFSKKDKQKGD